MTEPTEPEPEAGPAGVKSSDDDALDELASAHVDGRTSTTEAARIAADHGLQDRVRTMAEVRDAVGRLGSEPVDANAREAAIGAALAAFDEIDEARYEPQHAAIGHDGPAPEATVTSIVEVAARRSRASLRTLRLVAAAAVVALVVLTVPLVSRLGEGDHDAEETATAFDLQDDQATASAEAGGFDASGGATSDVATGSAPEGEAVAPSLGTTSDQRYDAVLGSFAEYAELEGAVRAALADDAGSGSGSGAPDPTVAELVSSAAEQECLAMAAAQAARDGGVITLRAKAVLDDQPVVVTVTEREDDRTTVLVVDPALDCAEVATGDL